VRTFTRHLSGTEKRYIDTGKVRFIFREFRSIRWPPEPRCWPAAPTRKILPADRDPVPMQRTWAVEKPIPPLMAIAKQAGFTEQSFNACLSDRRCSTPCRKSRSAPPTSQGQFHADLFINGKMQKAAFDRGTRQGDRPAAQGLTGLTESPRPTCSKPGGFRIFRLFENWLPAGQCGLRHLPYSIDFHSFFRLGSGARGDKSGFPLPDGGRRFILRADAVCLFSC